MTKQEEIKILTETANKLGKNSYCGEWLASIIPVIAADMANDFVPNYDVRKARLEAEEMRKVAKEQAAQIVSDAKSEADLIERRANETRKAIIRATKASLEKAIDGLPYVG